MHSIVSSFSTQSTLSLTRCLPIQLDDDTAIKISLQHGAPTLCLLWNLNWKFLPGQHFFLDSTGSFAVLIIFQGDQKNNKRKKLGLVQFDSFFPSGHSSLFSNLHGFIYSRFSIKMCTLKYERQRRLVPFYMANCKLNICIFIPLIIYLNQKIVKNVFQIKLKSTKTRRWMNQSKQ